MIIYIMELYYMIAFKRQHIGKTNSSFCLFHQTPMVMSMT